MFQKYARGIALMNRDKRLTRESEEECGISTRLSRSSENPSPFITMAGNSADLNY